MARYLICQEGRSNKFYEIEAKGKAVHIRYGRIGANGTKLNKSFGTVVAAEKFVNKAVQEKLDKGYTESTDEGDLLHSQRVLDSFQEAENESREQIEAFIDKYRELFNDFNERDFGCELFTNNNATLIKHSGTGVLVQGRKYSWDFVHFPLFELFYTDHDFIAAIVVIKEAKGRLDECPLVLLDRTHDTMDPNDPDIPIGDTFYPENFRGYMTMLLQEYLMCDVSDKELEAITDVDKDYKDYHSDEENEHDEDENTERKPRIKQNYQTFATIPSNTVTANLEELEGEAPAADSEKRLSPHQLRLAREAVRDLKQFSLHVKYHTRPAQAGTMVQWFVVLMFVVAFVLTVYLVMHRPAWLFK